MDSRKATRRAALALFLILAVFLVRGLLIRSSNAPTSPPPQPGDNLRLCTKVLDGDTIVCEGVGKIRLIGIDSPELGSPGGEAGAQFLQDRIQGKRVEIEVCPVKSSDRYHRTRAIIYLPTSDGRENINRYMVASGYAVVSNLKPCHVNADEWLPLQDAARRRRLGLWALAPESLSAR